MADDLRPGVIEIHPGDPKWEELKRQSKAKGQTKTNGQGKLEPIRWLDLTAPLKDRAWFIPDYVPDNNVALVSGEGSVGKSILTQQLGTVTALNGISGHDRDWLGLLPKGGRFMYVSCEEDEDELRRREEQMAKFLGTTRKDLEQAMRITSWIDYESTQLMAVDKRSDCMRPTDLYARLLRDVTEYRPRMLALDTAADLFGGSEINRNHTRTFISYMRRLSIAAQNDCAAFLLTHPSLEGIRSGTGLSGSTAWHNSVRSRCVFKQYKEEDDDAIEDPDLRVLEWRKNNYGPAQATMTVRYKNGVYVVEGAGGNTLEQQLRWRNIEAMFLELLRKYIAQNRSVSASISNTYAPAVFEDTPEAKAAKPRITSRDFAAAMERLLDAKRIKIEMTGPPSKRRGVIVEASNL